MKTKVLFLIMLLCAAVVSVHSSYGNTITVTNTNDSGPGSLRDALAVVNDGDMIDATGVSGTILLTSGVLPITHSVTINGPGAGSLAVNGNASSTVFENFASAVTISDLTITNGNGDGIGNQGGLTLSNSSVVSNAGVGISNFYISGLATLTIINCTVSGNSGGGISNIGAGANGPGGVSSAQLTVSNCTISGNSASNGGGINNSAGGIKIPGSAVAAISNSTLSDNSATGNGGAISNDAGGFHAQASVSVESSTLSGNSATGHGGGIYNNNNAGLAFAELDFVNTILNAGASGGTIFNNGGTAFSRGYNLASDAGGGVLTGAGDQINTDPMLGPLQDNGGPTFTHALLPGSPAIDAGDPSFAPPPFYDQRGPGYPRVVNSRIDKGSFEVQSGGTPTPTPTLTPAPTPTATPSPKTTPTPRPRPTPAPRL